MRSRKPSRTTNNSWPNRRCSRIILFGPRHFVCCSIWLGFSITIIDIVAVSLALAELNRLL
jgi:tetrahydromethanopterin S-methyltransferase subunit B